MAPPTRPSPPGAGTRSSAGGGVGLARVRIRGYRAARDVVLDPGPVCALVGEANAGKSTILAAVWTLLEPAAPPPGSRDAWREGDGRIRIEARVGPGQTLYLETVPPDVETGGEAEAPPVVFLPAELRGGDLIAPSAPADGPAQRATALLREALARRRSDASAAARAVALVEGLEACLQKSVQGLVLLVEEPELLLRPQLQRYLYRLLRSFAAAGNQVLYSTHAPAFLNVARLEELAFVEHRRGAGTAVVQPEPLEPDESFRALSEFDAERSELFLSRAALLVEGRTEKLVFPLVFQALGRDHDREAISIVECGGKPNMPLFARVCEAAGVPYVLVHDRDAPAGRRPIASERAVNAAIAAVAPPERVVVLEPDFEAVAGLQGHSHKPERAWRSFGNARLSDIPEPLLAAARRVLEAAR
jgi:putative ATP-dependent endonuclease of the OLD family